MARKAKFQLVSLYVTGLFIILILFSTCFSYVSLSNLVNFGKYIIRADKDGLRHNSSLFFMEITRRTALEHSVFFSGIADLVMMLSEQIRYEINNKNQYLNSPDSDLVEYGNTNFFYSKNYKKSNISNYYWGDSVNINKNIRTEITNICRLKPIFDAIYNKSDFFIENIWIDNIKHTYATIYPANDLYKIKLKRERLEKDYKSFLDFRNENPANSLDTLIMTFPYKDIISGRNIISLYNPIKNYDGRVVAYAGVDVNLDKIINSIREMSIGLERREQNTAGKNTKDDGFIYIIDKNGDVIYFPDQFTSLFNLSANYDGAYLYKLKHYNLLETKNKKVRLLINKMINNKYGKDFIKIGDNNFIVAYSAIKGTNWVLGYVKNEATLMLPIKKTVIETSKVITHLKVFFLSVAVVFFIVSLILSIIVFRIFYLNPLARIKNGIKKVSSGDFNVILHVSGAYEIVKLQLKFNSLCHEIKMYTKNLRKEVEERQEAETEIRIAADVQKVMFPRITDQFKRDNFDLYALNEASAKISGGFYDYFFIDDDILVLVVANVSGGGISASFFMAMSKVTIKNFALSKNNTPASVLNKENITLLKDNDAGIYTEAFICFIDINTGKLIYSNAGNVNAFILDSRDNFSSILMKKSLALGIKKESCYEEFVEHVSYGDILVLCSDATINSFLNKEYELNRAEFRDLIIKNRDLSAEKLCSIVHKETQKAKNKPRDVNILIFKRTKLNSREQ